MPADSRSSSEWSSETGPKQPEVMGGTAWPAAGFTLVHRSHLAEAASVAAAPAAAAVDVAASAAAVPAGFLAVAPAAVGTAAAVPCHTAPPLLHSEEIWWRGRAGPVHHKQTVGPMPGRVHPTVSLPDKETYLCSAALPTPKVLQG